MADPVADPGAWQKAVVALANKNARILWAVLAKGRQFDADHVSSKPEGPTMTVAAMASVSQDARGGATTTNNPAVRS